MQPKRKVHPAIAALIVIVLVGIVTSVVIVVNNSKNAKSTAAPATSSTKSTDTMNYKDGTYSATASYVTPGGIETVDLTITLTGGVITDSQISASGNTDHAKEHQGDFESGYKALIIGKKVDDVHLSRVSGSSLTSSGFNSALDEIKQDAKA